MFHLSSGIGQTKGFFGHNNFIEFSSVSNIPFHANTLNALGSSDGLFGDWEYGAFNTGLHFTYGRVNKMNRIISIDAGVDFLSFYSTILAAQQTIRCFSLMPKIEFAGDNIMVPVGIINQFGIGGFYIAEEYEDPVYGIDIMYGLVLRSAISKRLLLHYGFRLSLSLILNSDNFIMSYLPYEYRTDGDTKKRYNLTSFDFGLTYLF